MSKGSYSIVHGSISNMQDTRCPCEIVPPKFLLLKNLCPSREKCKDLEKCLFSLLFSSSAPDGCTRGPKIASPWVTGQCWVLKDRKEKAGGKKEENSAYTVLYGSVFFSKYSTVQYNKISNS